MSGTVVYQAATLATPGPGIVVGLDAVDGTVYQQVKLDVGPSGTSVLVSYAGGTGMPVQGVGTFQALGTIQPLAGSVHIANTLLGTVQVLGSIQVVGTDQVLGTTQPLPGSIHLASRLPGTTDIGTIAGTVQILGTTQPLAGSVHLASRLPGTADIGTVAGTLSVLGTIQPLAGSVHLATNLAGGTTVAVGSALHGAAADIRPLLVGGFGSSGTQAAVADGQAVRAWFDLNGRQVVRGTVDAFSGTIGGGTVQVFGTAQILGTMQSLAGSVHLASRLPGTADVGTIAGTVAVLGTISVRGTVDGGTVGVYPGTTPAGTWLTVRLTDGASFYNAGGGGTQQVLGTIQPHGTGQMLGTVSLVGGNGTVGAFAADSVLFTQGVTSVSPIAGISTVQTIGQGSIGALAMTTDRILLVQARGGTLDGGTVSIAGSVWGGTFSVAGTAQILGTTQPLAGSVHLASRLPGTVDLGTIAGTVSMLGTTQPLAGSVHLASTLPGGSVSVQGYVAQKAPPAGNPFVMAGFGSSGTQAAIGDGSVAYAWLDPNGRLQIRGTIDSLPNVTIGGGTVGAAGGTFSIVGTVQPLAGSVHLASRLPGTVDVGTIAGTVSVLGSVQPLAGSVHVANVAAVSGTVRTQKILAGEGFFGSVFTAAVTNGTLVAAPASGTYVRVWDLIASGSAAGTAFFELGDGTPFGHVFTAANGGLSFNSAKGVRTNGTRQDILFNCAAGSWGVSVSYSVET